MAQEYSVVANGSSTAEATTAGTTSIGRIIIARSETHDDDEEAGRRESSSSRGRGARPSGGGGCARGENRARSESKAHEYIEYPQKDVALEKTIPKIRCSLRVSYNIYVLSYSNVLLLPFEQQTNQRKHKTPHFFLAKSMHRFQGPR